jgi:hypothetical protein
MHFIHRILGTVEIYIAFGMHRLRLQLYSQRCKTSSVKYFTKKYTHRSVCVCVFGGGKREMNHKFVVKTKR